MGLDNKGKSSGIRNIYYYLENDHTLMMVYVYEKSKQDDLSPKEIAILKQAIGGKYYGKRDV